jgi:AcrR family transcriptional regulator
LLNESLELFASWLAMLWSRLGIYCNYKLQSEHGPGCGIMQREVAIWNGGATLRLVLDSHDPKSERRPSTGTRREARTKAILRAALEELAASGYGAFSFEAVAARAGIAKTTAYRRYGTKTELVRAAVQHYVDEAFGVVPNTGSVRGDLIALGCQTAQMVSSVLGQSLLRLRMLDRVAPELDQMGQEFEEQRERTFRPVALRAIARGELSNVAEFHHLLDVLSGTLLFKLALKRVPVDEVGVGIIVDQLLDGVSKPTRRRSASRTRLSDVRDALGSDTDAFDGKPVPETTSVEGEPKTAIAHGEFDLDAPGTVGEGR